ncbi:MAG: hypothetical protein MI700_03790 [Balneolales bacterium]|nr:hypothetical protein [Balneolales bacterium]
MKYSLIPFLIACIFAGCGKQSGFTVKVDMSHERDQGRFNPEDGDIVSMLSSVNDWEPGVDQLEDPEGDWIFEIDLDQVSDTLEFKFAISSEVNLDLPNAGLEIIPNRRLPGEVLKNDPPVLIFNRNWNPYKVEDITFKVSMNNQEVLDFFDPERDQVVVTGSFLGWDANGIVMDDKDGDGIYERTVPVELNSDQPQWFKFKMIKHEDFTGYVPNGGWEITEDRVVSLSNNQLHYFNNQQRIARFIVDSAWLNQQSENGIEASDMYQIRFYVGEDSYLSDPLEHTDSGELEVSISIPLQVDRLVWTIVENQSSELIAPTESVVTHLGKKIIIP